MGGAELPNPSLVLVLHDQREARSTETSPTLAERSNIICSKSPATTMNNVRLSRSVCAVVAEVLQGSHETLNALFESAGAPGPPPDLPHARKWKEWLFRIGNDPKADSLVVLGNLLEEFMDLGPREEVFGFEDWKANRERVVKVLEENGLRYYRGGRVLPQRVRPRRMRPRRPPSPASAQQNPAALRSCCWFWSKAFDGLCTRSPTGEKARRRYPSPQSMTFRTYFTHS